MDKLNKKEIAGANFHRHRIAKLGNLDCWKNTKP